jgi:ferredoxin
VTTTRRTEEAARDDATDAPTTTTAARRRGPGRADVGELFPDRDDVVFVIDQSRCIGCNACVQACASAAPTAASR